MSDLVPDPLDHSFDRYARMVRRAIDVPVALVTVVEAARQVFIGAEGLDQPWSTRRETPLSHSFCQYVVNDAQPLVIDDARRDGRLSDNLAIPNLHVIAYAGFPITEATGTIVGSLCAIDTEPREWKPDELDALRDIAAACSTELGLRQLRAQADRARRTLRTTTEHLRTMLSLSNSLVAAHTVADVVEIVRDAAARHLGCSRIAIWLDEGEHLRLQGKPALDWPPGRLPSGGRISADAAGPLTRAMGSGRPLLYADKASQDSEFPELAGLTPPNDQARAFLPMTAQGHVVGCLVLLWPAAREFDPVTVDLLNAIGAYTAQALDRARLLEERTTVAHTLQRAMLSPLPQPCTLQLAARYRAAAEHDEVGGDWYDAVIAPNGATHVMIGDVMGHDVAAASMMGQLRNMLRALAWQNPDDPPSRNVERLDRMMRDLALKTIASLVFARIEQTEQQRRRGERTLRWTNAGHPPPILVGPDGAVIVLAREPADTLLGVLPHRLRRDQSVTVRAGSTLLLYTDGLVETATTDIRDGITRLCEALADAHQRPVEQVLDAVIDQVAGARHDDDIAVLAVRFDPQD